MFFKAVEGMNSEEFCRLTGAKRETYERMLGILKEAEGIQKAKGGRPCKLSMEDRLLMALCYWREYRTYFHIAHDYGISESACFRRIVWIENTITESGVFALPGKKALMNGEEYEEILIDVTESPIERPKKSRSAIIQERKNVIQ